MSGWAKAFQNNYSSRDISVFFNSKRLTLEHDFLKTKIKYQTSEQIDLRDLYKLFLYFIVSI